MFNLFDLFKTKKDVEPTLVVTTLSDVEVAEVAEPVEVVEVVEEVEEVVKEPAQPVLTMGKWCEMSGMVRFAFKKTSKASREECPRCGRHIHCGKVGRFMPHHEIKPVPKS
jgi:endonuclease III